LLLVSAVLFNKKRSSRIKKRRPTPPTPASSLK